MPGPGGRGPGGPGGPGRMGHGGPPPPPPGYGMGWGRRRGCLPGCLMCVLGVFGLVTLLVAGILVVL